MCCGVEVPRKQEGGDAVYNLSMWRRIEGVGGGASGIPVDDLRASYAEKERMGEKGANHPHTATPEKKKKFPEAVGELTLELLCFVASST
jgi:hypothetical protein